jgi:MYXO-CTERM domain-containing protein
VEPSYVVVEHHDGDCNCGTYTLYNNTVDSLVYELFVSNPDPYSADANRSSWSWNTFSYGSGSGVGAATCGVDEGGVFGGESGFCYFDDGFTDPVNPIGPGEHQTFFFNSSIPESTFLVLATDGSFVGNTTEAAPEPATLGMAAGALGLLGLFRRRKNKDRR